MKQVIIGIRNQINTYSNQSQGVKSTHQEEAEVSTEGIQMEASIAIDLWALKSLVSKVTVTRANP